MKPSARLLVATLLFVSLCMAVGYAQGPGSELVCKVPFQFSVNDRAMPAGQYKLTWVGFGDSVLSLENMSTHEKLILNVGDKAPARVSDNSHLTFNKYGDRYFLSLITVEGGATQILRVSTAELEAKAAMAGDRQVILNAK